MAPGVGAAGWVVGCVLLSCYDLSSVSKPGSCRRGPCHATPYHSSQRYQQDEQRWQAEKAELQGRVSALEAEVQQLKQVCGRQGGPGLASTGVLPCARARGKRLWQQRAHGRKLVGPSGFRWCQYARLAGLLLPAQGDVKAQQAAAELKVQQHKVDDLQRALAQLSDEKANSQKAVESLRGLLATKDEEVLALARQKQELAELARTLEATLRDLDSKQQMQLLQVQYDKVREGRPGGLHRRGGAAADTHLG